MKKWASFTVGHQLRKLVVFLWSRKKQMGFKEVGHPLGQFSGFIYLIGIQWRTRSRRGHGSKGHGKVLSEAKLTSHKLWVVRFNINFVIPWSRLDSTKQVSGRQDATPICRLNYFSFQIDKRIHFQPVKNNMVNIIRGKKEENKG